jgi:hypothetical protein
MKYIHATQLISLDNYCIEDKPYFHLFEKSLNQIEDVTDNLYNIIAREFIKKTYDVDFF